jgi:tRNA(Ile)-lysidine synthase
LIQGADKFINEHIEIFLKDTLDVKQKDKFSLKLSVLETFDAFIQGEIIEKAITKILKHQPISLKSIDNIINLLKKPVGSIFKVNNYLTVLKDREQLIFYFNKTITRINIRINKEGEYDCGEFNLTLKKVTKKSVNFSRDSSVEFFDYDILPMSLELRNIELTDKFQPLGMSENVNITDFLTNNKVPYLEKQKLLVLAVKSEIIWICGIRINEKYKVTQSTNSYLKAELKLKNLEN